MAYRELSGKVEYIRRFSFYRIIEHLALIALFVALAVTGLSQKFHTLGVSQSIISALGGIDSARFLHHAAGALFTASHSACIRKRRRSDTSPTGPWPSARTATARMGSPAFPARPTCRL